MYKYDYTHLTRSTDFCRCEVCKASKVIIGGNLPGAMPKVQKRGRPKRKPSDAAKVVRMCNMCLSERMRGKKHECNSSQRTENLSRMLKAKSAPPKAAEAAVSEFLTERVTSSGMKTKCIIVIKTNNELYLI